MIFFCDCTCCLLFLIDFWLFCIFNFVSRVLSIAYTFQFNSITVDLLFVYSVVLALKSAQFLLHTCYLMLWKALPVSALLHAATMLLQGYTCCRCSPLLEFSPITLIMYVDWSCTAFLQLQQDFQNDIKRIIAFYL